jgi:RNA polymerase sigma factor (sigma-70 family)
MADIPTTRASLLVRLRDLSDQTAWKEFTDLYGPLVYRYARKQGLQDADAADLGQEVFGAVARAVGGLEYDPGRGSFRNWLFTIVRHKLANWRSASGNRLRGRGDSETQRLLEQCPVSVDEEADWQLEWEERMFDWACEQVRKDVTDLTWQAFWRTAVDGQSGKQVSVAQGMTIAAVYRARSRVLARIKELVQIAQEP